MYIRQYKDDFIEKCYKIFFINYLYIFRYFTLGKGEEIRLNISDHRMETGSTKHTEETETKKNPTLFILCRNI